MNRKILALAVLAACPALSAQAAEPLSSSYLEAAYLNSTVDDGSPVEDEVEGFRARLSLGLHRNVNFVGDFDQRRYLDSRDGFWSVGLAGHTLDPNWQAFGAVTYEVAEHDDNPTSAGDHEESGYGVEVGGRAVIENVEFHAAYKYLDLGNVAPDIALTGSRYGAGLALDLSAWWSLSADYTVRTHEVDMASNDMEWTEWSVGFRRYFVTQTDRHARKGGLLTGLFGGGDEAAADAEPAAE